MMKTCLTIIILFVTFGIANAQREGANNMPASFREGKITARWTDRANIVSGAAKPDGQFIL